MWLQHENEDKAKLTCFLERDQFYIFFRFLLSKFIGVNTVLTF